MSKSTPGVGESPERLSRIPGFDPRQAPLLEPLTQLPAIPLASLQAGQIRRYFRQPKAWQAEFVGDQFKARNGAPRPAAVLVPLVMREHTMTVLLTERTAHLRSHAGQVAFPGGRRDPIDQSPVATALREAQEEVGLEPSRVEIVGALPEYLTGTGYAVIPVVGLVAPPFDLSLQQDEVAHAFEVPLSFLMDPSHHKHHMVRLDSGTRQYYSMSYREHATAPEFFIWGATAAMLRNLYRFFVAQIGVTGES